MNDWGGSWSVSGYRNTCVLILFSIPLTISSRCSKGDERPMSSGDGWRALMFLLPEKPLPRVMQVGAAERLENIRWDSPSRNSSRDADDKRGSHWTGMGCKSCADIYGDRTREWTMNYVTMTMLSKGVLRTCHLLVFVCVLATFFTGTRSQLIGELLISTE